METTKTLIYVFLFSFLSFAQKPRYGRAYELSPGVGAIWMNFDQMDQSAWDRITRNYSTQDLIDSSFTPGNFYAASRLNVSGSLNFAVALRKVKEEEQAFMVPMLRFSLNTSSGFASEEMFTKNESFVYDSIIQGSTGYVTYLDSTVDYYFLKSYRSSSNNFSTAVLFHANRNRIFSFYLGLGASFGLGTKSRARIQLQKTTNLETFYGYDNYDEESGGSVQVLMEEDYRLKNYFVYNFFVPIGFDVRLYKRDNFFGRSVLSLEGQFGANWMNIPEIGTMQNTSFRLMFAYKYRI